jgi:hypothetical protein
MILNNTIMRTQHNDPKDSKSRASYDVDDEIDMMLRFEEPFEKYASMGVPTLKAANQAAVDELETELHSMYATCIMQQSSRGQPGHKFATL